MSEPRWTLSGEAAGELVSQIGLGRKLVFETSDWEKLVDWLNVAINDRVLGQLGLD